MAWNHCEQALRFHSLSVRSFLVQAPPVHSLPARRQAQRSRAAHAGNAFQGAGAPSSTGAEFPESPQTPP